MEWLRGQYNIIYVIITYITVCVLLFFASRRGKMNEINKLTNPYHNDNNNNHDDDDNINLKTVEFCL